MKYELVVLGCGSGASSIYDGLVSSSFMLLRENEPFCLVDLGLCVGKQVLSYFGHFPEHILITHNHSDHAAELPVVLRVEQAQGRKLTVLAQEEVAHRLKTHRLAEHLSLMSAEELASWKTASSGEAIAVDDQVAVTFFEGVHSEFSCGFLLSIDGQPRLAYTGDSKLDEALYSQLDSAGVFIIDSRPKANAWHASFDEVKPWLKAGRYILGHGLDMTHVRVQKKQGWPLLLPGDRIEF
ncbi:MBL fold metallo-hydrolase [Thiomicrorhabdus sp. zzn3]|uniref:MBL fold metallo-hydrolase n=1 Tax=Thiomicrorhabdus sp. zzn3 TaxID=3039775 RepID=UPI002436C4C2|nr:MBL fold metallo-hydrolase [Thiomicrorhabdus sp. zzn3]MDG6778107.1 MBL fold metallo-hydrolase [Thiomicrorhabdus sp. zzn3]